MSLTQNSMIDGCPFAELPERVLSKDMESLEQFISRLEDSPSRVALGQGQRAISSEGKRPHTRTPLATQQWGVRGAADSPLNSLAQESMASPGLNPKPLKTFMGTSPTALPDRMFGKDLKSLEEYINRLEGSPRRTALEPSRQQVA
eukprot:CAMPEP_0119304122 /NCGR_PEP_ID=MMETSP1333-20130426/5425_1 /TAXON_ID=418940 /ORGANISM="Scyphosphaera apsteinii, Strain RCC1455" /LENGTH=145 /DNA_ID=CAMNT_0007306947 /DNA_START=298 /DNA_END=735 /DNA_ORIENTATION=-